ncbi:MAG: sugar phosphate nucleotidyltransferase [Acidimicrobiales bacterium]
MVQILILAGGLGTRLWPRTASVPKALVPVAGRPFAEHQLELLAANGIEDIVFAVAYRGDMIRRALGDGRRWGVRIRYSDEGTDLRGTGGAVRLFATSALADEIFAVIYGDSYLLIDYADVWEAFDRCGLPALMTVLENRDRWDTSNAAFVPDGRLRYRKGAGDRRGMTYIDYGLSVLTRDLVLERVAPDGAHDLADLFAELGERGELAGHEVAERFYEIGSDDGLADLEALLARHAGVGR